MKKIIALLALVMLFLVSCKEEETPKEIIKNNPDTPVAVIEGDVFSERAAVDDELEEVDYNNREFRVVGQLDHEFTFNKDDINKGDLIKDAKYKRDSVVEERFNVDIVPIFSGTYSQVAEWTSKSILSGIDEFDLLMNQAVSTGSLVLKNLFLNWYDIPNVDFSKPWWAKSTANELTYDDKCIVAISDANSTAIYFSFCMVFNKNLANAYDLGNIYDAVFSGDWTYEYFYDLIKDIYRDDDGSGLKSEGDFYGISQGHDYLNNWLYAFDNPIMSKDEDGVPQITLKSDKINNIVSTMYDFCYNTQGVYYNSEKGSGDGLFLEKKAIFTVTSIAALLTDGFRGFEDEYGLLPMPKWDKSQSDYYTTVSGGHTVMAVPKTAKDLEFVGTISEALAAESYKHITPTYYEIALKTRYLRDNESKKVLDILIDGRRYDFGYIYNGWQATYGDALPKLMKENNPNFESFYQKNYGVSRLHYKSVLKAFDRLG